MTSVGALKNGAGVAPRSATAKGRAKDGDDQLRERAKRNEYPVFHDLCHPEPLSIARRLLDLFEDRFGGERAAVGHTRTKR